MTSFAFREERLLQLSEDLKGLVEKTVNRVNNETYSPKAKELRHNLKAVADPYLQIRGWGEAVGPSGLSFVFFFPILSPLLLGPFYGDILEMSFNEAGMIANCNGVHTKNCNHISKTFQGLFKDQVDFQGPSTKEYNFTELQKCTFSVYFNKALRFELFASPISIHFSVDWSKIKS